MELLAHVSTSGHLLMACMQAVVAIALIRICDVHVIMGTCTYPSPPFVDYYCESVRTHSNWHVNSLRLNPNATLWDGQVCEGGGSCCQLNNPPWFTKNLTTPTTDGIELRLCLTHTSTVSDVALELLELYIQ